MKPISLTVHGAIDYLAVVIFAVAPAAIGLSGWPAALSYALAGIHLLMTLLTDFPAGVIKVIPIFLHQWVELIVGPVLVILAFVLTMITRSGRRSVTNIGQLPISSMRKGASAITISASMTTRIQSASFRSS